MPGGFLAGKPDRKQRVQMLLRHHLLRAFKLPATIFPNVRLDLDILIWQRRDGRAKSVPTSDAYVADGRYWEVHPEDILGRVKWVNYREARYLAPVLVAMGIKPPDKSYKGGLVEGPLPDLPILNWDSVRPLATVALEPDEIAAGVSGRSPVARRGKRRIPKGAPVKIKRAISLGSRVIAYRSALSQPELAAPMQPPLAKDLLAWVKAFGEPSKVLEFKVDDEELKSFVGAFDGAELAAYVAEPPAVPLPKFGSQETLRWANHLYGQRRELRLSELSAVLREVGRTGDDVEPRQLLAELFALEFCLSVNASQAEEDWILVPQRRYNTGQLWPEYDALGSLQKRAGEGPWHDIDHLFGGREVQFDRQEKLLEDAMELIGFEEMAPFMVKETWIPIQVIASFIQDALSRQPALERPLLFRDGPLIKALEFDYANLKSANKLYGREFSTFIGYLNNDSSLFQVPFDKKKGDTKTQRKAKHQEARLKWSHRVENSFLDYVMLDQERQEAIADAYNRLLRGYVEPEYSVTPLPIESSPDWTLSFELHPYNRRASRKLINQRGGLLALDVGLGKTFCGLALLSTAKQQGWADRPVIIVPKSLALKWKRDIEMAMADVNVITIGIDVFEVKGVVKTRTDNSVSRGRKWSEFAAGLYDVVVLTYPALGRTQLLESTIREYAQSLTALSDELAALEEQQEARSGKRGEMRDIITAEERLLNFTVDRLTMSADKQPDAGITWEDIGVDFIMVDEAQNFKNLYLMPSGAPIKYKYVGTPGVGSKRAFALDARCYLCRQETGGAGVTLLSATPAKNSPLEFYSICQYVDGSIWSRHGIRNPTAFIDRFFEPESVLYIDMATQEARNVPALKKFKNLQDLKRILSEVAEFRNVVASLPAEAGNVLKEAEQRGWKHFLEKFIVPEPISKERYVDLDDAQEDEYERILDDLDAEVSELESEGKFYLISIVKLKAAAKLVSVTIHPGLLAIKDAYEVVDEENIDEETGLPKKKRITNAYAVVKGEIESGALDPSTPKFDECAKIILATKVECEDGVCQLSCGHIIFAENKAVHAMMQEVLIRAGLDPARIAVLNRETAEDIAVRQDIADRFNGNPEEGLVADYDVVIANSIAYEGVDLQRRTCQIHHLDLPWDPATVQQRNGRGVRQGNKLSSVMVNYYLARRSSDAVRYKNVTGKAFWMNDVLGGENVLTNPSAQTEMSDLQIDMLLSRDPLKVQALYKESAARKAKEDQRSAREELVRHLSSAEATLFEAPLLPPEPQALYEQRARMSLNRAQDILVSAGYPHTFIFDVIERGTRVIDYQVGQHLPLYEGQALPDEGDKVAYLGHARKRLTNQIGLSFAPSQGLWGFGSYRQITEAEFPRELPRIDEAYFLSADAKMDFWDTEGSPIWAPEDWLVDAWRRHPEKLRAWFFRAFAGRMPFDVNGVLVLGTRYDTIPVLDQLGFIDTTEKWPNQVSIGGNIDEHQDEIKALSKVGPDKYIRSIQIWRRQKYVDRWIVPSTSPERQRAIKRLMKKHADLTIDEAYATPTKTRKPGWDKANVSQYLIPNTLDGFKRFCDLLVSYTETLEEPTVVSEGYFARFLPRGVKTYGAKAMSRYYRRKVRPEGDERAERIERLVTTANALGTYKGAGIPVLRRIPEGSAEEDSTVLKGPPYELLVVEGPALRYQDTDLYVGRFYYQLKPGKKYPWTVDGKIKASTSYFLMTSNGDETIVLGSIMGRTTRKTIPDSAFIDGKIQAKVIGYRLAEAIRPWGLTFERLVELNKTKVFRDLVESFTERPFAKIHIKEKVEMPRGTAAELNERIPNPMIDEADLTPSLRIALNRFRTPDLRRYVSRKEFLKLRDLGFVVRTELGDGSVSWSAVDAPEAKSQLETLVETVRAHVREQRSHLPDDEFEELWARAEPRIRAEIEKQLEPTQRQSNPVGVVPIAQLITSVVGAAAALGALA